MQTRYAKAYLGPVRLRTLVDLSPQVRLFLVYKFEKLRRVVTQGMRDGK
jgi:hypothetical protein